jgi:hypothetical protein
MEPPEEQYSCPSSGPSFYYFLYFVEGAVERQPWKKDSHRTVSHAMSHCPFPCQRPSAAGARDVAAGKTGDGRPREMIRFYKMKTANGRRGVFVSSKS